MNNVYGAISIPPNTPTVVVGLTVPPRGGYSLKGLYCSSQIDCFVQVFFNVEVIASGWVTGTVPNLFLDFGASPYGLGAGDMVAVMVTQNGATNYPVDATLLAEQL